MTKVSSEGIQVVDGVTVDITVRGNEDVAEKVMIDLTDRLGWIAEAYDTGVPPDELTERDPENTPPMRVGWREYLSED